MATRRERALTERMYLLIVEKTSGDEWCFQVKGQSDRVYTLLLNASKYTCSCPDHMRNHKICKHQMFLLIRVSSLPPSIMDDYQNNRARMTPEFFGKFNEYLTNRFTNIGNATVGVPAETCSKEKQSEPCPICFDALGEKEALVNCEECHNWFHMACIKLWLQKNTAKTCPYCRSNMGQQKIFQSLINPTNDPLSQLQTRIIQIEGCPPLPHSNIPRITFSPAHPPSHTDALDTFKTTHPDLYQAVYEGNMEKVFDIYDDLIIDNPPIRRNVLTQCMMPRDAVQLPRTTRGRTMIFKRYIKKEQDKTFLFQLAIFYQNKDTRKDLWKETYTPDIWLWVLQHGLSTNNRIVLKQALKHLSPEIIQANLSICRWKTAKTLETLIKYAPNANWGYHADTVNTWLDVLENRNENRVETLGQVNMLFLETKYEMNWVPILQWAIHNNDEEIYQFVLPLITDEQLPTSQLVQWLYVNSQFLFSPFQRGRMISMLKIHDNPSQSIPNVIREKLIQELSKNNPKLFINYMGKYGTPEQFVANERILKRHDDYVASILKTTPKLIPYYIDMCFANTDYFHIMKQYTETDIIPDEYFDKLCNKYCSTFFNIEGTDPQLIIHTQPYTTIGNLRNIEYFVRFIKQYFQRKPEMKQQLVDNLVYLAKMQVSNDMGSEEEFYRITEKFHSEGIFTYQNVHDIITTLMKHRDIFTYKYNRNKTQIPWYLNRFVLYFYNNQFSYEGTLSWRDILMKTELFPYVVCTLEEPSNDKNRNVEEPVRSIKLMNHYSDVFTKEQIIQQLRLNELYFIHSMTADNPYVYSIVKEDVDLFRALLEGYSSVQLSHGFIHDHLTPSHLVSYIDYCINRSISGQCTLPLYQYYTLLSKDMFHAFMRTSNISFATIQRMFVESCVKGELDMIKDVLTWDYPYQVSVHANDQEPIRLAAQNNQWHVVDYLRNLPFPHDFRNRDNMSHEISDKKWVPTPNISIQTLYSVYERFHEDDGYLHSLMECLTNLFATNQGVEPPTPEIRKYIEDYMETLTIDEIMDAHPSLLVPFTDATRILKDLPHQVKNRKQMNKLLELLTADTQFYQTHREVLQPILRKYIADHDLYLNDAVVSWAVTYRAKNPDIAKDLDLNRAVIAPCFYYYIKKDRSLSIFMTEPEYLDIPKWREILQFASIFVCLDFWKRYKDSPLVREQFPIMEEFQFY